MVNEKHGTRRFRVGINSSTNVFPENPVPLSWAREQTRCEDTRCCLRPSRFKRNILMSWSSSDNRRMCLVAYQLWAERVNISNLDSGRMATLGSIPCAEARDNSEHGCGKPEPALLCYTGQLRAPPTFVTPVCSGHLQSCVDSMGSEALFTRCAARRGVGVGGCWQ